MNKPTVYDVLVVYTDGVATSASSKNPSDSKPFSKRSMRVDYNDCYAYFLDSCHKNGITAAFTTSKDLTENGFFSTHWVFEKNAWKKKKNPCFANLIFDKFSPINNKQKQRRTDLFANIGIEPFNPHTVFSLFFDKQKTYNVLGQYSIPTVALKNSSKKEIDGAIFELQKLIDSHPTGTDFSRKIVMKDRYGAGGNNIFCTDITERSMHIQDIMTTNNKVDFILQPFTKFKEGYVFKNIVGFVDVRVIYLGTKIIQAYIRTAAEDDFRCNMHQGGSVEYIPVKDIPRRIIRMAKKILKQIDGENSLVALDFIISNNGNPYLMEGNSGPGLNWSLTIKEDEKNTKKLIREIVKEIDRRTNKASELTVPCYDKTIFTGEIPIGV